MSLSHVRTPNLFAPELGRHQPTWRLHLLVLGAYLLLVMAALKLGDQSGANCMAVGVPSAHPPIILRMGFWCEINHGPLYLFGGPAFYLFGMAMIERANRAFAELRALGRLRGSALEVGGSSRRKVWLAVSCAIFIGVFALLFKSELGSRDCTRQIVDRIEPKSDSCFDQTDESAHQDKLGRPEAVMGWVQAEYLDNWVTALNENRIRNTEAELNRASGEKIQKLQGGAARDSKTFFAFLLLGLSAQAVLISFAIWALVKMLHILCWMWQAFARRSPSRLEVVPFFFDPMKRFGLRQIDDIYRAMLTIVICAGLALYLNISNNVAKGSSAIKPGTREVTAFTDLRSQLLLWMLPLVPAVLILVGPRLLGRCFQSHRQRLAAEIKESIVRLQSLEAPLALNDRQATWNVLAEAESHLYLLEQQVIWPREDRAFSFQTGAVALFFLVLPTSIFISATAATYITSPAEAFSDTIGAVLKLPEAIKYGVDVVRGLVNSACGPLGVVHSEFHPLFANITFSSAASSMASARPLLRPPILRLERSPP